MSQTRISDLSDLISDYQFEVPTELIAQEPSQKREAARLLLVRRNPEQGLPRFEDLLVSDLPQVFSENICLKQSDWIRNRSRVFPARFYARRPTGGKHEIVLLEALNAEQTRWTAIIRGSSDFKYPQTLFASGANGANDFEFSSPETGVLDFQDSNIELLKWLWAFGEMPLPPYIKKRNRNRDLDRYQSVWSHLDEARSAAAPTASLHFSHDLLQELGELRFCDVSLHVGLGTFAPVRCEKLSEHNLHWEHFFIPQASLSTLSDGSAKTCIGTTALRCLESFSLEQLQEAAHWSPTQPNPPFKINSSLLECERDLQGNLRGRTRLFVKPGHRFRHTQHLWTNFHLPESTLFVLLACFAGSRQLATEAYQHAISRNYRFFSFGDASLWL